jgi:hypothetical protein
MSSIICCKKNYMQPFPHAKIQRSQFFQEGG